jgi:hypothetical protein
MGFLESNAVTSNVALILPLALDRAEQLGQVALSNVLQKLSAALPEPEAKTYRQWWQANGEDWCEQLTQAMIQHRNIGHYWQLTDEDAALFEQYWQANKLLVECLNSECYVTRPVREKLNMSYCYPANCLPPKSPTGGGLEDT